MVQAVRKKREAYITPTAHLSLKIKTDMKKAGMKNVDLEKALGVHKSTISNILNGRNEPDIITFIKLVSLVYNGDRFTRESLIQEYLDKTKQVGYNRTAMEYFQLKGDKVTLENLINKQLSSSNYMNREAAKLYKIALDRQNGLIKGKKVIESVTHTAFCTDQMKVFAEILKMYGFLDIHEFSTLFKLSSDLPEKLEGIITDSFSKNSYMVRIKEMHLKSYFFKNDILKSREMCQKMMQDDFTSEFMPRQAAEANHIMAHTYVFKDFEKTMFFLNKAEESLKVSEVVHENSHILIRQTKQFTNVFHGKLKDSEPEDEAEKAHYYALRGDRVKAVSILNKLKKDKGELSAFQLCYMGLATKNREFLYKSIELFEEQSNLFYAQLPRLYLEKI